MERAHHTVESAVLQLAARLRPFANATPRSWLMRALKAQRLHIGQPR